MRKLLTLLFVLSAVVTASQQPAPPPVRPRPAPAQPEVRLVLLIAVDQFRYDYLTRFRKDFTGGFDRLLTQGAVFTDANLEHYPTVTAIHGLGVTATTSTFSENCGCCESFVAGGGDSCAATGAAIKDTIRNTTRIIGR